MNTTSELLFDDTCYTTIPDADSALSFVRYYSHKAPQYFDQLIQQGISTEEAMNLVDTLWRRIIDGCKRFNVPLTPNAEQIALRLGI
jgi:hypothetical protein